LLWVCSLQQKSDGDHKEQSRFSTFIETFSKILDLLIKLGAVVAAIIKLAHYL
jgi:hypothetical protein